MKAPQVEWFETMAAGVWAKEILYLGPPDSLTFSPIDPTLYLDPDYFNEMNRRAHCLGPNSYSLDWDQILQLNPLVPRKYHMW